MIHDTGHAAKFDVVVTIDSVDYSQWLAGSVSITAEEGAPRVATFAIVPQTSADLSFVSGKDVTIDIVLQRGATTETYRRFTGKVESQEFDASSRLLQIIARDAYEQTILACADPDAVYDLLADAQPYVCEEVHGAWNYADPDPLAYFEALEQASLGATFIDSFGVWRAVPWAIDTEVASLTASDVDADSLVVSIPNRDELPANVVAKLVHRHHRLHSMEVALSWEHVDYSRYLLDGLPNLPKSTVQAAIDGISDWYVKGKVVITEPTPGSYPVIVGGVTRYYLLDASVAPNLCDALSATLYRRWYQDVETVYSYSIPMGGIGDDETVSATLNSDFNAGDWERADTTETTTGLYSANAPTVTTPPTGYEGLSAPWPPANGAMNWFGSHDIWTIQFAATYVVAQALRRAAEGKRKRQVRFSRMSDPRFEIGQVLAVAAYDVAAKGQIISFDESIDLEAGNGTTTYVIACPEGDSVFAEIISVDVVPAEPTDSYAGGTIVLGNHIGAAYETPAVPDEDALVGFLCNVLPTADSYDSEKPVFNTQFRIIMPQVDADARDPVTVDGSLAVAVTMCSGNLEISF